MPQYPFISKTLRDSRKAPEDRKHCCGMTIQNEGMGYPDLNDLLNNPCDLEFTLGKFSSLLFLHENNFFFFLELLSAELPDEYEKESWQLNDAEKLKTVDRLKNKGNDMYKAKNYIMAEHNYRNALGMIEQLILK